MITKDQLNKLAKKNKINESTIFREYLQLLFLSELYSKTKSNDIFFKGGTAIHFIYQAPRFSEDLDFTVERSLTDFTHFIKTIFASVKKKEEIEFKEQKSIAGKRYLLIANPSVLNYQTFVHLDFSFREKVFFKEKSIIKTDYPILFTSYIYHLSKEEILAEKIRALLTREKGRDLYDLWYLVTQGGKFNQKLVAKKLFYYKIKNINEEAILERVKNFPKKDFILDLKPFVPLSEREKLESLCDYIKDYLEKYL